MKIHTQTTLRRLVQPDWAAVTTALALAFSLAMPSTAEAASNLADSLTGYTGTSQDNYPAQPAFLAGSGLDVTFVWGGGAGAWEKIGFDSSGAAFGAFHGGGDGRNYLRTIDNNYAPVSFSAFVTVNRATRQSVFFGMGTGNLGSYKAPDAGSGNASVFLELQDGYDNAAPHVLGGTPSTPSNVEVYYNGMTTVTGPSYRPANGFAGWQDAALYGRRDARRYFSDRLSHYGFTTETTNASGFRYFCATALTCSSVTASNFASSSSVR